MAVNGQGWSITDEDVAWINVVVFPVVATAVVVGCFLFVVITVKRKPRLEGDYVITLSSFTKVT